MMHSIKIINREQQPISSWAGGTTTQIAIYPEDSLYLDRDFLWRLSTAVVEVEESTFTSLAGFDRRLMVLEGELLLVHKEHHTVRLRSFEQDSFKGEWDTTSYGRARDFNLMLKEGLKGSLRHIALEGLAETEVKLESEASRKCFYACYCYTGEVSFKHENKEYVLTEGELLLMEYNSQQKAAIINKAKMKANLIEGHIEL
jgi:environmental stress-induced protein Ves